MFSFLKNYFRKKIIDVIYSEKNGLKQFIYEQGEAQSREQMIKNFKQKYQISESFRFNGVGILLYGEGKIIAEENSYISDHSMLQSYKNCTIRIGKGCSISSNVRIFTQTNNADQDFSNKTLQIKTGDVNINDFVWIGANVIINPGITIGNNSVIGANSVVTKNIPENCIYGGVPAKLIRTKKQK